MDKVLNTEGYIIILGIVLTPGVLSPHPQTGRGPWPIRNCAAQQDVSGS